jgi:hypothetical protein
MVRSVRDVDFATWKPRGGNALRVADGSWLRVRGVDADMAKPWFSQVRWYVQPLGGSVAPLDIRMVQTGPVGTVDRMVEGLLKGDYVAEYSAQGGTIVLASNADASQGLVAWRGAYHEAYTWVNVPGASHAAYLADLDGMAFTDTPEGLLVKLTLPGAVFDQISVTKDVPGAGFVEFRRATDAAADLPKWAGAKLRSGETWRQTLPPEAVGDNAVVLVHASPQVVAVIHPEAPGDQASDASLRLLQRVDALTWS